MDPNVATTAPLSQMPQPPVKGNYTPAQQARIAKAKDVAQKFEASFLYQVLETSNPVTADKNNPMSGGFGEEMYRHQLNEEAAKAMAARGGVGLADHVLNQMAQRGDIPQLKPPVNNPYAHQQITTHTPSAPVPNIDVQE